MTTSIGRIIIATNYEDIYELDANYYAIRSEGKRGIVDLKGNIIVQPKYESVSVFREGLAIIKLNGKWGFVDKIGNIVVQPVYEVVEDFSEGFAGAKQNGKCGYVDKTGRQITEFQYYKVGKFNEGHTVVFKSDKVGKYQSRLVGDVMQVTSDVKAGFIDKTGAEIVLPKYLAFDLSFKEGLADVTDGKNWGFVNNKGTVIIPLKFGWVTPFVQGLAKAKLNGRDVCIDRNGNEVAEKGCMIQTVK